MLSLPVAQHVEERLSDGLDPLCSPTPPSHALASTCPNPPPTYTGSAPVVAGSTLVVAGSGEQRVDSASKCDGGADLARDGLGGPVDGLVAPVHWIFFLFSCFLIRLTKVGRKAPGLRSLLIVTFDPPP